MTPDRRAAPLLEKAKRQNPLRVTRQKIALELGSSREAGSRLLEDPAGDGGVCLGRGMVETLVSTRWNFVALGGFITDKRRNILRTLGIKQPKEIYKMKRNMSNTDRIIRVVLALVFFYLYFGGVVTGALGIALAVLGAVFLLTSLVAFCPLYLPFKINTNK